MTSTNESLEASEARIQKLAKERADLEREQKRMRKIELEFLADAYARKLRSAGFTIEQGIAALRDYKHFDAKPVSPQIQKPIAAPEDKSVFRHGNPTYGQ